jgi:hypothetical protein
LGEQGAGASPPDRARELALMTRAAAGDTAGRDLATLRYEVAEPADVLVVDQVDPIDAELANLAAPEPAPLDGLRCWRNGSILLLVKPAGLVEPARLVKPAGLVKSTGLVKPTNSSCR